MSVGAHLNIDLAEYDSRIRTFVPHYDDLVRIAGESLRFAGGLEPRIVDLGIGTGALAAACLDARPEAELVGVDNDPGMLRAAAVRLAAHPRVKFIEGDFLEVAIPPCDAIVACISLHHVRTPEEKRTLYGKCHAAMGRSGILVTADCFPGEAPALAAQHREAWLTHLEKTYSRREAEAHLSSWAEEDVYFSLGSEVAWLREAGFEPEVLWRNDGFAVLAGFTHGAA